MVTYSETTAAMLKSFIREQAKESAKEYFENVFGKTIEELNESRVFIHKVLSRFIKEKKIFKDNVSVHMLQDSFFGLKTVVLEYFDKEYESSNTVSIASLRMYNEETNRIEFVKSQRLLSFEDQATSAESFEHMLEYIEESLDDFLESRWFDSPGAYDIPGTFRDMKKYFSDEQLTLLEKEWDDNQDAWDIKELFSSNRNFPHERFGEWVNLAEEWIKKNYKTILKEYIYERTKYYIKSHELLIELTFFTHTDFLFNFENEEAYLSGLMFKPDVSFSLRLGFQGRRLEFIPPLIDESSASVFDLRNFFVK